MYITHTVTIRNSLNYKLQPLFLIVAVSASTEAFVGTFCLIAVRRSVSGEQVVLDVGELVRPLVSVHRIVLFLPDEQRQGVLSTLPHLQQPVCPET